MAVFKKSKNLIPKIIGAALALIFGQKYENDTLELSNGIHEIEIEIGEGDECETPNRVWVSFDDESGDLPVCGGNVDKVGVVKTHKGFILYADIKSTSRVIRWFASLG